MEKEDLILQTLANIQTQMDERFGQMDERFGQMDERFGQMQTQMDKRFGQMQTQMDERFGQMQTQMDTGFKKVDEIYDRQILMENQLAATNKTLYDFISVQRDINKDTAEALNRIETKVDGLAAIVTSHEVSLKKIK